MLIELRIRPGRFKISRIVDKVRTHCRISQHKVHPVPHITLYGTFRTNSNNIQQIIKQIEKVSRRYDKIPYVIDGLGWVETDKGKAAYFRIDPSDGLQEFRRELATGVYPFAPDTPSWDREHDYLFHATIAHKLTDHEFKRVGYYLETNRIGKFYFPLDALRITLLDNTGKIICEYDFLQKKILSRPLAKSKEIWRKTLQLYRRKNGMELDNHET